MSEGSAASITEYLPRKSGEDAESKSSGGTVSNTSPANSKPDPSLQLGAKETKIVRNSKRCVYLFLILVAIIFSLATWYFVTAVQQGALAQSFTLFAQGILAVSTINALRTFALFEAAALHLTTNALTTGQQWPFFTLDMFEVEADLLYNQTQTGDYIAIHPIVKSKERLEWEAYATANQGWIQDGYRFFGVEASPSSICPYISDMYCTPGYTSNRSFFAPAWQLYPAMGGREAIVNYDGLSDESFARSFSRMFQTRSVTVGNPLNLDTDNSTFLSFLMTPIFENIHANATIVAALVGLIPWNDYFKNLLPVGVDGIHVVVTSEWEVFTFKIDGPEASYLGPGDLHDRKYDSFLNSNGFAGYSNGESALGFTVNVYPTQEFEDTFAGDSTNSPLALTMVVASVFLFAISVFFVYDLFVERRQKKVMLAATKSSAIVNSLFPANVRDRLMEEQNGGKNEVDKHLTAFKTRLQETLPNSKPIADLFPEATVMFADIAGFTAWSSLREPSQVFVLLESLYNAFDKIAVKMKVFKVETIGDSYVAVAGLPEPRKDHAEVMARFAHKCLIKMNALGKELETVLGPGTSELKMRVGLHSGSVTAGVLRGEKSRFQLFGDTVNTAARMESTGVKNRIQLSKETADRIIAAGKEHWIKPRANKVFAKGKGELQTFWFVQGTDSDVTESLEEGNSISVLGEGVETITSLPVERKLSRTPEESLVQWNVENLCIPLKKLVASRQGQILPSLQSWRKLEIPHLHPKRIVLDEIEDIIILPDNRVADLSTIADSIVLEEVVVDQLTNYVAKISSMYRSHAFHNFDHASHVAQSVTKLLSRVATPDSIGWDNKSCRSLEVTPGKSFDFTLGLTGHPMTHFAVILSAVIHDVDHPGVPNATLVKEGSDMAIAYRNQSVAEQNSVDIAWGLLMEPQYEDLRRCIYTTQAELECFRKLLVNTVLATDVMDKELGNVRKRRWDLAFRTQALHASSHGDTSYIGNRKATIIIEYLMQASDVAHTMQHWQIYITWNEKFFQECYQAFLDCRSDRDPREGWYEGELAFFDFYVIPLAKRLKECGVFGVCSDEYLNYAISNREEWSRRGKEMVSLYLDGLGKTSQSGKFV